MKTKLIPALFIIVAVSIAAAFFFTKKFKTLKSEDTDSVWRNLH